MTQRDIEKKLGLKNSVVSKWEKGKCQPQIDRIPDIAAVLGCTVEEVVACFSKEK